MEADGFAAPGKPVLVGQRQMHARTLHRRQGLDGTRQPLSPRWKLSRSWNCVMPKRLASISSNPTPSPWASLYEAKRRRTSCTRSEGTRIAPAIGVLVGHIHLRQLRHDGTAILVRQIREQHPVVRLAAQYHRRNGGCHQRATPTPRRIRCARSMADSRCSHVGLAGSQGSFDNCGHLVFQYGRPGEDPGVGSIIRACTLRRSLDKPRI